MKIPDKDANIEKYLEELKIIVKQDRFEVDLERGKNKVFMNKYGLRHNDTKSILLSLSPEDFIERILTENTKYNSEYLYIFKRNMILDDIENEDDGFESEIMVKVYIKTSIPDGDAYKTMIVVSFHKDEI